MSDTDFYIPDDGKQGAGKRRNTVIYVTCFLLVAAVLFVGAVAHLFLKESQPRETHTPETNTGSSGKTGVTSERTLGSAEPEPISVGEEILNNIKQLWSDSESEPAVVVFPDLQGVWQGEWVDERGVQHAYGYAVPIQLNLQFQDNDEVRGTLVWADRNNEFTGGGVSVTGLVQRGEEGSFKVTIDAESSKNHQFELGLSSGESSLEGYGQSSSMEGSVSLEKVIE